MQDFRRLVVWERAHAFSLAVKQAVRAFPRTGSRELKAQILRASDSIVSNIVEGCGASTRREFARYLDISIKSASEVDYRLQLARDDGWMSDETWQELARMVVEIRKMLYGLRRSIRRAQDEEDRRSRLQRRRQRATDDR